MRAKIIRLKEIELSKRTADECVIQAAKFGIQIEEFDAINGLYCEDHLTKLNIKPAKKIRPGARGCTLSHVYLWKECIDKNVPYLIVEHDGYFIEPLPENILDKFKDILKLDNCNPYSETYEQDIVDRSGRPFEVIDLADDPEFHSVAGKYSRGSYAYIIKPHAAKMLIDWISINGFLRSDHQLGTDICDVKTVSKTIVRLHPYYLNRAKSLSMTTNFEEFYGKS